MIMDQEALEGIICSYFSVSFLLYSEFMKGGLTGCTEKKYFFGGGVVASYLKLEDSLTFRIYG